MIDLNKLEHFVEVARVGSFVGAAQRLHISQSALSRSIQSLEKHYKVVLFYRDRSGVRLTAAGEQLLADARDLVLSAESVELALRSIGKGVSGRVRFGIGPFAASIFVPPLIARFAKEYPEIEFDVVTGSNESMLQMLIDGSLEFVIGKSLDGGDMHHLDTLKLLDAVPNFYARAGHPLVAQTSKVTLGDLARYGVISGSSFRIALEEESLSGQMRTLEPVTVVDNLSVLADILRKCDRVLASTVAPQSYSIVELDIEDLTRHIRSSIIALFTYRDRVRQPATDLAIREAAKLAAEQRDLLESAREER